MGVASGLTAELRVFLPLLDSVTTMSKAGAQAHSTPFHETVAPEQQYKCGQGWGATSAPLHPGPQPFGFLKVLDLTFPAASPWGPHSRTSTSPGWSPCPGSCLPSPRLPQPNPLGHPSAVMVTHPGPNP